MLRSSLLAFVFGIWLLQQQATLPALFYGLCLLPPGWLAFKLRRHPAGKFLFPTVVAGAGFFWAALLAQQRLADVLPAVLERRDIEVVGVVAALPKPQERGERFLFDVEQVLTTGAHVPATISLVSYMVGQNGYPVAGRFHPGERWRMTVRLKRPHGSYNPDGFDYEVWALEHGIRATGYLRRIDAAVPLSTMVWRPSYVIERLRETVRDRFGEVLGGQPYEGVLRALAIGDDSGITRADWKVFLRTGVNHLMSISGLHVTMVSGLFFGLTLAGWRRVPQLVLRFPARKAAMVAGILAALGYALLAGFAVPAQRTVYMLGVVALALWSNRNVAISLVLCWALVIVALLDPWAVLAPGFWLSFAAVAVIVYASSHRLGRPHWLREAMQTQWAVTLGLVPLLLALFQQVSMISPLANLFAIPLVSLIVVPLTLIGAVLPVETPLLLAHQIMAGCMSLLQWLSALPAAVWQQHAPPVWTIALAVAGLFWLLMPRGVPARWLGMIACLPMFLVLPAGPAPGELRVNVLDVGQGLAVVAQTAHHALLFDAGGRYSSDSDSGSFVVVPFLRGAGIARLDGFIVSHDDLDHSGGAASVLEAVPVDWLAASLPAGHELLANAPHPRPCFAGQQWQWDGVSFEMLHPAPASYSEDEIKDNDRSCVLKITSPHGSVLLPADIEEEAERQLLATRPASLDADVLVVPHHGSRTSSSEPFLKAVAPGASIFTVGYRNRFGHPKPEVVERYRQQGGRIYRSDEDGAVMLNFAAGGITIRTWRAVRPRYWLAESLDAR